LVFGFGGFLFYWGGGFAIWVIANSWLNNLTFTLASGTEFFPR
jgi:hypothetical protein